MLRNAAILGQHFAFAHGRSGVLQQHLLTQTDLDRLLGTHDPAEMQTMLLDLPLTKPLNPPQRDPALVLQAFGAWVRAEVASMIPEKQRAPFDILWLEGDAPLLAALLKERRGLTSAMSRRPLPPVTAYPQDAWERLVLQDDAGALPADITAGVRSLMQKQSDDPADMDAQVALLMAERSLQLARQSGSDLLVRFVRHTIDVQNIRTALRIQTNTDDGVDLLPGGTIHPQEFAGTDDTLIALVRRFGFYALADTLEEPGHTGSDVEQALSAIRAQDIRNLWNRPLTIEPVFAFAATALTQLSLLRAILIGKQSGLSPQEIKKLLPPFLSASHYA